MPNMQSVDDEPWWLEKAPQKGTSRVGSIAGLHSAADESFEKQFDQAVSILQAIKL